MAEQLFPEETQSQSIGERLQRAREERGLALEDVAAQTRIPVRHLQAIEREDWDALPAITYCIGFVRSYANAVGLDGSIMGRELRESLGGFQTRAPAPEYYQPADPSRVPPRSLAIIAGLIAVALIIAYMVWRSSIDEEDVVVANVSETAPVPATGLQPTAPRPPQQPQPAAMSGQPVTLVATGESWVRIEDQGGATLFQGIMAAGQRFPVPPTAQNPVIRTARPHVLRVLVGNRDLGPLEPVERSISNVSLRAPDLAQRLQPSGGAAAPAGPPPSQP